MDQDKGTPVMADKEIEVCQQKIMEIIASAKNEAGALPDHIVNGSDAAKAIAGVYAAMGEIYLGREALDAAKACFDAALQLDPHQWAARLLSLKTKKSSPEDMAKAILQGLVVERPQDASLHSQLGKIHYDHQEGGAALDSYRKAFAANPKDATNLYGIANAQLSMGDIKAAEESYVRAIRFSPLLKTPANKPEPDFSVLNILSPFAGNTPTDYLVQDAPFETNHFTFLKDQEYDINLLKSSGQVVVNIVSEADMAHDVLPQVKQLLDRLDMPVIKHPSKIQKTTREDIERLLRDIPGCRLARVARHVAGEPTDAAALESLIPFLFPVLARPTGTHGGKKFEKIDSLSALESFIKQEPEVDHYLIEYVDYKSLSGHFRKYRFIFVDDQVMPYHLAIGDNWKVHHGTTDMANHQWMQDEEKEFLARPETFFSEENFRALRTIQKSVGLEYFGIDCGLNQAGELVVFEVNASMLVHDHNKQFPYKSPFVHKIKKAFENMLRKHALEHGRAAPR